MASKKNTKVSAPISKAIKSGSKSPQVEEKANKFSKNVIKQSKSVNSNPVIEARQQTKEELEIEKVKKKEDKLVSEEKINVAFSDLAHGPTSHQILNKNNQHLPEIPEGSIHLAVTSPPYFNAR